MDTVDTAADESRTPDRERATVLIVDDERDLTELYAAWLADDHDVITAFDGETALERLTDDVDVVLLDRRMPDLTGDDVLAEIRERGLDSRVAMVTAIEPELDIIEMGFDDYVTKPVDETEIKRVVRRLIALREYDDLLREHFALASKIGALEASLDEAALESSEEYADLVERFEAIDQDATRRLESLMHERVGDRLFGLFDLGRGASLADSASASPIGGDVD